MADKDIVVSGMRPTGACHIGHLLGALDNWVALQQQYPCFYFSADWHAVMSEYRSPQELGAKSLAMVRDWLACGLDPKKSVIFRQVDVPQHTELFAALCSYVPVSWLERSPTYKEQLQQLQEKDVSNYAFLGYPVLQTADIALYKGTLVPVGEDQAPHLEICREIVRRFNQFVGPVLREPQAKHTKVLRLLGTDNRKMSKSYGNVINLGDDENQTEKIVQTMVTDPQRIRLKDPGHPEVCNVFSYYQIFAPRQLAEVEDWCRNSKKGCSECKKVLGGHINDRLRPIRENLKQISPADVETVLAQGREKASAVAQKTMDEVHGALGLAAKAGE